MLSRNGFMLFCKNGSISVAKSVAVVSAYTACEIGLEKFFGDNAKKHSESSQKDSSHQELTRTPIYHKGP